MKELFTTTAAIEAGAGIALLIAPSWIAQVLGTSLGELDGLVVMRVAGAVLLALGAVCWHASRDVQSRVARGAVVAMLLYNVTVVIVIAFMALAHGLSGAGLTSVSVLHAVLAGWCIACLLPMNPARLPRNASPDCSEHTFQSK